MKRMKIVGLLCLAAFAVTAMAASTAFAAAPEFGRCVAKAGGKFENSTCTKAAPVGKEKFEWEPGPGPKNGFSSKIKVTTSATLETTGGTKITCKQEESKNAEVKNAKEVGKVVAKFNECLGFGQPCSSTGAASGEIITASLGGVVGVEKLGTGGPVTNKLASELHAEGGGNVAEFACAGVPVVVKGSVLHPATANKMTNVYTEKFAGTKGEQKPDKFAGGPADEHILESNNNGGPFEEAGQTITSIATFEEKIELSSVN
jgi:hypothetical protein